MKSLYLNDRLLILLVSVSGLFCLGFPYPIFFTLGQVALFILFVLVVVEVSQLFSISAPIKASRDLEDKLSNGDENRVCLRLNSVYHFVTFIEVIDEFPVQLQLRDRHFFYDHLPPQFEQEINYTVRPTERGKYSFGRVHVLVSSRLALVQRRLTFDLSRSIKVYPSFIQAKKFSFLAINNRISEIGVKKIRKLGANNEFEQIREYVQGDDFRTINWKASAHHNDLMVNQYQEERAQNVYCLIDKGRLMHMPFDGMTLMDYAVNTSLVMASIAIYKNDRSGLVTFSDKIGSFLLAQSNRSQISTIADLLYDQETRLRESDFARLYRNVKMRIRKRSLLILFTNFDSYVTLRRQLAYLKVIGKDHLLCTVVFDNTEINAKADNQAFNLVGAYEQTMAEKAQYEKQLIIKELNKNGIYTILTEPQQLTINTINKYIELKARAAI